MSLDWPGENTLKADVAFKPLTKQHHPMNFQAAHNIQSYSLDKIN